MLEYHGLYRSPFICVWALSQYGVVLYANEVKYMVGGFITFADRKLQIYSK